MTMIERVAIALHYKRHPYMPWEKLPEAYQLALAEEARAALEIMREPTEHMIDMGGHEISPGWTSDENPFSAVANAWRSMLDAALKK